MRSFNERCSGHYEIRETGLFKDYRGAIINMTASIDDYYLVDMRMCYCFGG
jgi:hypothetical protein